jgi:hypothetical protein
MLKTLVLVCAAMTTCTASGLGMHMAGWFSGTSCAEAPISQIKNADDPLQSDAAMRYRHNQTMHWRVIMTIR